MEKDLLTSFRTSNGLISSSTSNETKYLPAPSFEIVTVEGLQPFGSERDQTMFKGSFIFASVSMVPSQEKAEAA